VLGLQVDRCVMPRPTDDLILRHFGLRENPFGVTPDPRFLSLTHTHREALASLINGIECGFGFQLLVAQPGMGKTTLLFDLLERFRSSRTAFLFQQQHDSREFLQSLLLELHSESIETTHAKLYSQLNNLLTNTALTRERVIVVVDEAQNLEDSLLETLRQLSNFETTRLKLLQIVLAGQPQLAKKIARPEQEQLRQRISTIARLNPLGLQETLTYLSHRLNVAGYRGGELFTPSACQTIWSHAHGIPRNINTLCFNAMLLAFAQGATRVDERAVQEAIHDLDLDYVLANLASVREPSAGAEECGLASHIDLDRNKPDNNQGPVTTQLSLEDKPLPPETQSVLSSGGVNVANLTSPANAVASDQKSTSDQQPPGTQSSVDSSPHQDIREPGATTLAVATAIPTLSSGSVLPDLKLAQSPQPAPMSISPIEVADSVITEPASVSSASSWGKVAMALLVAAAVCAGVLFGEAVGTRRQRRVEEILQSLWRVQQAQTPPQGAHPLPGEQAAESRTGKESRPRASDNLPEVVTRKFSRATDESPEVITRNFPSASGRPALGKVQAIFFDVDSAAVSGTYSTNLQSIAEILVANPQLSAIIEGHTDSSGEESYNSELSNRRALAVKDVLVNKYHISATRLNTVGAGSSGPIQSNSTGNGRAYNRRVEVRMSQQGG